MDHSVHNKLVSFIWSIADDCLRDVYVRGKYRDVILPMVVLRRLDALLELSKEAVMEEVRFQRDEVGLTKLEAEGLQEASGYVFYNTSEFTLRGLAQSASNNRQIMESNFQTYLDGFSDNVKEIVGKFKLRAQVRHMAEKDVLLDVLEKFTSPYINLTPHEGVDAEGHKLPPLTNLGMGYVFEELIRKFNEENNEEAGEHFTPREVIKLMTHILFEPVKQQLPPVITVYDGACGSGGMLTESQKFMTDPNGLIRAQSKFFLYGKEVNDETYAICKSDMMIKGNDPKNIRSGSTLATNEFSELKFDFMLSNPPYGKSWKSDMRYIKPGKEVLDTRFKITLSNWRGKPVAEEATPRSSDGQLLFLMDMVSKMKSLNDSALGSRIASVHNGSSLFTGDAGSGESNIRRHLIENDWLEAIIQLPNNLFYNTGITTYIWVLSNKKAAHRRGKVQLINASELYRKLRKNLGAKNCEFAPEQIAHITQLYLDMPHQARGGQEEISKVFDNADFGYFKVTIERPQRLAAQFTPERLAPLRFVASLQEPMAWAYAEWGDAIYRDIAPYKEEIERYLEREGIELSTKNRKALFSASVWHKQRVIFDIAEGIMAQVGRNKWQNFNEFRAAVDVALKQMGQRLTNSQKKQIFNAVSWYDANAAKVIKKAHKLTGKKMSTLLAQLGCRDADLADFGYWPTGKIGLYHEYEADSNLRDSENVPLNEQSDAQTTIHHYFLREVRPHVEEAWINLDKTKIGYEISFNKYFYQHTPLRTLADVTADILRLEAETDGLLKRLVNFAGGQ